MKRRGRRTAIGFLAGAMVPVIIWSILSLAGQWAAVRCLDVVGLPGFIIAAAAGALLTGDPRCVAGIPGVLLVVNVAFYGSIGACMAYLWSENRSNANDPPGRCARCDYDLTGDASGVCPECGTEVNRT